MPFSSAQKVKSSEPDFNHSSTECCKTKIKTKTEVILTANQNKEKYHKKLLRTQRENKEAPFRK